MGEERRGVGEGARGKGGERIAAEGGVRLKSRQRWKRRAIKEEPRCGGKGGGGRGKGRRREAGRWPSDVSQRTRRRQRGASAANVGSDVQRDGRTAPVGRRRPHDGGSTEDCGGGDEEGGGAPRRRGQPRGSRTPRGPRPKAGAASDGRRRPGLSPRRVGDCGRCGCAPRCAADAAAPAQTLGSRAGAAGQWVLWEGVAGREQIRPSRRGGGGGATNGGIERRGQHLPIWWGAGNRHAELHAPRRHVPYL